MRVAILTDSTAYLPEDVRQAQDIHMIPLTVVFGEQSFSEEVDLTTEHFYKLVKQEKTLPKTSQPAIGEMVAMLEKLKEKYDEVLAISLSSGISGTYQTMITASQMVEGLSFAAFDSEISCFAQGFYVLEAAKRAKKGASVVEILARLEEMKQSMRAYFIVDDLNHLHRGGRLSGAQALIGSVLQVKPILHFVDTKIVPFEKIRTHKKAQKRLLELFAEDASTGVPIKATVIHANCKLQAQAFLDELKEKYSHVDFTFSYVGPVIGTHLGEGALALGWYKV